VTVNKNYKYSDKTEKIIKSAFSVHDFLGNGFPEIIYQRCMEVELDKNGLYHIKEKLKSLFTIMTH
jgi:GxxExxY protein